MRMTPKPLRTAVLHLPALAALAAPGLGSHPITVDGDDSDWVGVPPAQIHAVAFPTNGEWICSGEANDNRTDPSDIAEPNFDITEVRLTADATTLSVLVRFRDVLVTDEVSVALGINTATLGGMNFLGDESGVVYNDPARQPETQLNIHNTTPGITAVERTRQSDGGVWSSPGGEASFISTANDLLEASVPLASVDLTTTSVFDLTLVSLDNLVAWNNDTDTTVDYPTCDAVDCIGGTPGVTQNAFDRDLSDGEVDLQFTVDVSLLTGTAPVELSVFSAD